MTDRAAAIAALLAQPAVARALAALDGEGEEARIVGGAVRNLLIGEAAGDIDIATTALPEETIRRGKAAGFKPVPTGIAHGTVTLVGFGAALEVTTLRSDLETDGRHAVVAFGRDFEADARRRDFTMNALSLSADGRVHDSVGGLDDLAARRVRFIGDAAARIREDYLRILRFFRFDARYGEGEPDREALAACLAGRDGLARLSRERVRAELLKLLVAPRAASALAAMLGHGLLLPVLGRVPHLARFAALAPDAAGFAQSPVEPAFRLAALALAKREDASRLRERLALSNAESARIEALAGAFEGMAGRAGLPAVATMRRLSLDHGRDAVAGALVLANAAGPESADAIQTLIAELEATPPFSLGGRDALALGYAAGPALGAALTAAREAWIEAGCPDGREAQLRFLRWPGGEAPSRPPGGEGPGMG